MFVAIISATIYNKKQHAIKSQRKREKDRDKIVQHGALDVLLVIRRQSPYEL